MTLAADFSETPCSVFCPPKITATRTDGVTSHHSTFELFRHDFRGSSGKRVLTWKTICCSIRPIRTVFEGSLPDMSPQRSWSALEIRREHHCMVVLVVTDAVKQGHHRPRLAQQVHLRLVRVELGSIALGEDVELVRMVVEPDTQVGAGCNLLRPAVERRALFRHPARPEPVDQHAVPVVRRRLVVDPLDAKRHAPQRRPP